MQEPSPKKIIEAAYKDYGNDIFRFCVYNTRVREDALDITQETFIKVLAYLERGKEIKNIRPFLYKTARNCIIDMSRKKTALSVDMAEHGDNITDGEDLFAKFERDSDTKSLFKLMDSLKDSEREILELRYLADMTLEELAETLGKTKNHTSVLVHRAEKKLQKLYSEI